MGGHGRPLPPRPRTARQRCLVFAREVFGHQVANFGSRPLRAQTALAPDVRRENQKVAQNVVSSTNVSSRGSSEPAESRSGSWTQPSPAGGARGDAGHHSPQCRKIFSITSPCGGSRKATTFIWPATTRTGQRVDLVHPLDEHGPGLAGAAADRNRCGLSGRRPGQLFRGGGFGAFRRRPRALLEYQP